MAPSITNTVYYLIAASAGGTSTFLLNTKTKLNKVQASALPTFIFSLAIFFYYKQNPDNIEDILLTPLFFGATFIGMTSSKIGSLLEVFFASIIYCLIFIISESSFQHIGGKLGLMACIALISTLGATWIFGKIRSLLKRFLAGKE